MENIYFLTLVLYLVTALVLVLFKPKPTDELFFLPVVLAAMAVASAVYKGVQAHKAALAAKKIHPNDPTYQVSEYAKQNLGLAQSLYNGRMAGATDLERNIGVSQANTLANLKRNATSSSQNLALAGATQGQADAAYNNLSVQEAQNKYALAGQLQQANRDMTGEQEKVYNDMLRKYGNDVNAKAALTKAKVENTSGAISDLAGAATSLSYSNLGAGTTATNSAGLANNLTGYNPQLMQAQNIFAGDAFARPSTIPAPQLRSNYDGTPLALSPTGWAPGSIPQQTPYPTRAGGYTGAATPYPGAGWNPGVGAGTFNYVTGRYN